MAAAESWATPNGTGLETLLELGQGGMATAYLARALGAGGFERLVVLKRLSLELRGTEGALDRFFAEARVAARLHHANVVGTHQIDRDAAGPFIVLDYVEGGSLDDLVSAATEREERLPVPVVLRIAKDVVAGLQAVHDATDPEGRPLGILHRDVSLQNILVGVRDGISRLADFGVAKSVLSRAKTQPGYVVGKVQYLPPEYLRGEPVDARLDLYALGVTLFIALTGREPWAEADDSVLPLAILQGVPSLEKYVEVAPELQSFVSRACARDAGERFPSAREMSQVLERFEREHGWLASHGEVATTVERLLGKKLQARRELLASLAPGAALEQTRELSRTRRVPRPHVASAPAPLPSSTRPIESAPREPTTGARTRARIAFAGAVVTLTSLAWLLVQAPEPQAAALSATPRPRVSAEATPDAAGEPRPNARHAALVVPTPPTAPTTSSPTAASASAPPPPSARPVSSPRTATRSRVPSPSDEPLPRLGDRQAPAPVPLSAIKTQNPYRHEQR